MTTTKVVIRTSTRVIATKVAVELGTGGQTDRLASPTALQNRVRLRILVLRKTKRLGPDNLLNPPPPVQPSIRALILRDRRSVRDLEMVKFAAQPCGCCARFCSIQTSSCLSSTGFAR